MSQSTKALNSKGRFITKRSLISLATLAALGTFMSASGAASLQYEGLGIKPQFQDYANGNNQFLVGGNFVNHGPYLDNKPIYTTDWYGNHQDLNARFSTKFCTYGDVNLEYTQKVIDDAIKNVAKPHDFEIYGGGLVFGSTGGTFSSPLPDVGANRANVYGNVSINMHDIGSETNDFLFALYGGGAVHSNLGEAIVDGNVDINLTKIYSTDGYVIGGGTLYGYCPPDWQGPNSNGNADVTGNVSITVKNSTLSFINGGCELVGDGKTDHIHANVGGSVTIDVADTTLLEGGIVGGAIAGQRGIANIGKNVTITTKNVTMETLSGGGNTVDELYEDNPNGYQSCAGKEAKVNGDIDITLNKTSVTDTLIAGGYTDPAFTGATNYTPKDGRFGDASVGGNATVTLLNGSSVKNVYMSGYGKGADIKGHSTLVIADKSVTVNGTLYGQGQIVDGKYTSTNRSSTLVFGTDTKTYDEDEFEFKAHFQDFDYLVATRGTEVELGELNDSNHGRLDGHGGSLLTIKGAGEFETDRVNLSQNNNLSILGALDTDKLTLDNATITVAQGGRLEVDDFVDIKNNGKVIIQHGSTLATLSREIFSSGLGADGTVQSAGELKANSPVIFEEGSSLTITDQKYNLNYAESAQSAFNTGTRAPKPNITFTGTLVDELGNLVTKINLNDLNQGVHEKVDLEANQNEAVNIEDKAVGGKTLVVNNSSTVNVKTNSYLTLVGDGTANKELIDFGSQSGENTVTAEGQGAGLVLGSTSTASAGTISAQVTITDNAKLTTQNGDFALKDVTLAENGEINVDSGNLVIDSLTVHGDTTIASTDKGSATVKDFNIAANGTTTVTGEVTAENLQMLDRTKGNSATINVGRNESRGDLKIEANSDLSGLTFFLDPVWKSGMTVADASRLVLPKTDLDANVIVGHNSYVVLGDNTDQNFLNLFKESVLTWGGDTKNGQVLAAAYIAKPVKITTGSLRVDQSLKAESQPAANVAGSVTFGPGSIMVGDVTSMTENGTLIEAKSFNVDKTSKAIIVGDLKKDQSYKLTNASNANFWNTKDTLVSGNKLWDLTINGDGTFSTKLNDANQVFGNTMQGHALANAGMESTNDEIRLIANSLLTDTTGQLSNADIAARFDSVMNPAGAVAVFTTAYDRATALRDAVRQEASTAQENRLWVQVTDGKTKLKGISTGSQGLHVDTDAHGFVMGAETRLTDTVLGAAFTAGKGDSENKAVGLKNDFDFYGVSLYGKHSVAGFDVLADGSITCLKSDLSLTNAILDLSTETDTVVYSLGAQVQKTFTLGVNVTPFVGLDFYHLRADGYNNTQGATIEDSNATAIEFPIGVELDKTYNTAGFTLKPKFHFAIVPTFGDRDMDSTVNYAGAKDTYNFTFTDDVKMRTGFGFEAEKAQVRLGFNAGYDWGNEERAATKLMVNAQYLF